MGEILHMPTGRCGARLQPGDYVTNRLRAAIGVVIDTRGDSVCLVEWPGVDEDRWETTAGLLPVTIWRADAPEHGVDELFGGTV